MASGLGTRRGGTGSQPKRVVRTGLALVHENEIVYPAAGSEAVAVPALDDPGADVQLHFAIVVEVADAGADNRAVALAEEATRSGHDRLARALRSS